MSVGGFIGAYENNFELGMVVRDLVIIGDQLRCELPARWAPVSGEVKTIDLLRCKFLIITGHQVPVLKANQIAFSCAGNGIGGTMRNHPCPLFEQLVLVKSIISFCSLGHERPFGCLLVHFPARLFQFVFRNGEISALNCIQ